MSRQRMKGGTLTSVVVFSEMRVEGECGFAPHAYAAFEPCTKTCLCNTLVISLKIL